MKNNVRDIMQKLSLKICFCSMKIIVMKKNKSNENKCCIFQILPS